MEVVEFLKWATSSMHYDFVFEFSPVSKKETVELSIRFQTCNNKFCGRFGDCQANVDENAFRPCINKSVDDAKSTGL